MPHAPAVLKIWWHWDAEPNLKIEPLVPEPETAAVMLSSTGAAETLSDSTSAATKPGIYILTIVFRK